MSEEQKPQVKLDEGGNAGHIILKVKGEVGLAREPNTSVFWHRYRGESLIY